MQGWFTEGLTRSQVASESEKRTHDVIVEDLIEQLNEAKAKVNDEILSHAKSRVYELSQEVRGLHTKLSDAQTTTAAQESNLIALIDHTEALEKELSYRQKELKEVKDNYTTSIAELLQITTRLEESQEQLVESRQAQKTAEVELKNTRGELAVALTERDEAKRKVSLLQQKVSEAREMVHSPHTHPKLSKRVSFQI